MDLLLINSEALPDKVNIEVGEHSEFVEGRWKKSFLGTGVSVPRALPQLTYRPHRATDDLLEEREATENLLKVKGFLPPEPITEKGIRTFFEIRYGEHLFKLMVPIKVEAEPYTEGWILYHEDLSILAVAPTMEECIDSFQEYFYVLWEEYANKKDDELTDSGQILKHKLLDIIKK